MVAYDHMAADSQAAPGKFCDLKHGPCHYVYNSYNGPASCKQAESEVTVVLIHGFIGSTMYFSEIAERLALHQRVLRYDAYGRGFTPVPDGVRMTTDLFVQQLYELLDKLGENRVDLLGYSMGGGTALSFASQHPTKVRNLCLVAPVGFPSMRKTLPSYMSYLAGIPGVSWLAGCAVVRHWSNRRKYGSEWVLNNSDDKRRLKELHDSELQRLPRERKLLAQSAANSVRWFSWRELGNSISDFKGPTLVIWGRNDRTVPEAASEARLALPQAKTMVVEGHGHAIPLQMPHLVAEAFQGMIEPSRSRL